MKRSVRKDCTTGRNLMMKYAPPLKLKKGLSVFLSILLLGTILPASSMAASIPSRSLRPIPYSPPPCESIRTAQKEAEANPEEAKKPKELVNKRTKNSKKYIYSSGIYSSKTYPRAIHKKNDKGGWEDIDENITKPLSFLTKFATWANEQAQPGTPPLYPQAQGGTITPLSLCLYAGGSSFDQNGTQSYEQMSLSNYTMGGQTFTNDTYLRYPNLRDLIPEDATLTSVQIIVTQDMATNPFLVEAKAITQSWNPTTNPLAILPTTVSQVPPITNTWDLSPGSPRADRSIDITAIATDWFSGIQSDYGICLSIPTPDINPNGITGFNLPVLVVKYDIQGIPSDPSHGGSYYMDNITPPVLIPGRSVFVDRIGDVDNPIHSFSITAYSMDQLIPFGEDTLSVNLTYEDVFPTTQSNVPFQTPRPISNNCFLTYSFPVLNGDPVSGTDIYPNNALSVVLPDNDTTPPGVLR